MQLFYCPGIIDGDFHLDNEESIHCTKVLRKKTGDLIDITDGYGNFYTAQLQIINPKRSAFSIVSKREIKKPHHFIHIAIAPTKNADRMEWFVEKAVEIGVDKISFLKTSNSERKSLNLERLRKKAISAMKQSVRAHLPELVEMTDILHFIKSADENQKFIAHLDDDATPYLENLSELKERYIVLIGPEGGFSNDEVDEALIKGYAKVKIGDYRLRTETAGIVACNILNQINH